MKAPLQYVSVSHLRDMLDDGGEIAVIDVREEGVFSRDGHILLASNIPLSQLELLIEALLPRRSVRIVVCDEGQEPSERSPTGLATVAAQRFITYGYTNVCILEGGISSWNKAGFRLYTGVYVPSKAFGEYILHHDHPPEVTAQELHRWKSEGRDLIILDSRPLDEYRRNSIPGAIDCPGAELVYRIYDLTPSLNTTIIVNCGGRTRSIIGAQALINTSFSNPVYALKDGTQGWHMAGFELDHGRSDEAPAPSEHGLIQSEEAARDVARRFGIQSISLIELKRLQNDRERTVYVLDVRSPAEFATGHLPDSRSAPGGQLIQATDTFLAVRNASVVLVDDNGARATTTAAWLVQMGWQQVYVLEEALRSTTLEANSAPDKPLGFEMIAFTTILPEDLQKLLLHDEAAVVDFASSLRYSEGHIPGAWHAVRSRLRENLAKIEHLDELVFTSPDSVLARYASQDAKAFTDLPIKVLEGGTAAWVAAGYSLEKGVDRLTGSTDDVQWKALDRKSNVEAAIREYLTWEVDLVNAIEIDQDFGFRRFALNS